MPSPAVLSLIALLVAIVLSMTSRINVGLVSLALAWLVGTYGAHQSAETIAKGFPSSLFITLVGMTMLFAAAESNGTLERLARRAARLARGSARVLPLVFFGLSAVLSAVGPGSVPAVALVAPLAMAIGAEVGVAPFVTSLMVANGANSGNLSPVSAVGVIANTRMAAAGVGGHPGKVMFANFAASLIVALAGYVMFGGLRARRQEPPAFRPAASGGAEAPAGGPKGPPLQTDEPFTSAHRLTTAALVLWILAVLVFGVSLGFSAIVAAILLVVAGAADEGRMIARIPWGVVIMVCGVSTLIAMLESTGGLDLFTTMLSKLATSRTLDGMLAFVTGVISIYSSTSGVVLPTFLPMVPRLVTAVGGGDPLAASLSINVGASLVDVSPLSTLGALCLAALPDATQARPLFRRLILWGFAMAIVGAVLCQLFAGWLARL
jgi:Na+/H+ antiporter NhaD/arsenite permease-like protein